MKNRVPILGISMRDIDESILKSKIVSGLSEKKSLLQIAKSLNISETVLKNKMRTYNLDIPKGYNSKYSFVDKEYFEKNKDLSKKELCDKLNCHYNTLRRLLKKYNCLEMFEGVQV